MISSHAFSKNKVILTSTTPICNLTHPTTNTRAFGFGIHASPTEATHWQFPKRRKRD
jgi:hypothetical protein